jgi:hypothetical protein
MSEPRLQTADPRRAKLPRLSDTPPVFFTVPEAAIFLRISVVTLGRWRIEGRGPPFRKFGRRVMYAYEDLLAWAKEQSRSSTSDKG